MTINEIRIEPHIVKPDIAQEYYAPKDGFVLWKIWIDDMLLTETCYPVDKEYNLLQLFTDLQFPLFTAGSGYLSVRAIQDYIMWCSLFDEDDSFAGNSPDNFLSIFPIAEFETVYQGAWAKTLQLKAQFQDNDINDSWKEISVEEISILVKRHFPRDIDQTAIYLEPSNSKDKTGKFFTRKMKNAIKDIQELIICEPPKKKIELRIGLDERTFKEAIWHIGRIDGKFAIFFEQYPYFPVWLQSPAFDKVLSQEPFNQDI